MSKNLRVVMAQLNLLVGDIQGNLQQHMQAAITARDTLKADVIVFSELSMTGYPPEDLLLRPAFLAECNQAINDFKASIRDIHCVIGHPYAQPKGLYNSCSLIYNGTILARFNKKHLPNYGVFDELRYFVPGDPHGVVLIHDIPVSIIICEDLWYAAPSHEASSKGARIIISLNASPFEVDKDALRKSVISKRARENNVPIVYVNQIGCQDDLLFDGGSMVIDATGKVAQQAAFFQEALIPFDVEITSTETNIAATTIPAISEDEKIYEALVMSVRDYVKKNNFTGALIGVSGGIDSALTLAIAVDALGKDNVSAIIMPSRFTADISLTDADELVKNLGVAHETISIEPVFTSFLATLAPVFKDTQPDTTEENIQARCRGVILMALSNKTGRIVLACGNRSEMAVGYATLYGDMAGGYAVLKDIPKMLVYRLSAYRNQRGAVIPQSIMDRAPTAELSYDQKDEDTLPPYPVLDTILSLYLNEEQSPDDIVAQGFERNEVEKIVRWIHKNEYKRKQSAIGPRINHTAFGRDRRYPVTSGFKR
jgi:NAD+ synthase (glutamine-hydrolysing)